MEDFEWRISIAEIDRATSYSVFSGIDRTQILLTGQGLGLRAASWRFCLAEPYQSVDFSGDTAVECELINGLCTVLYVMVRRELMTAEAEIIRGSFHRALDGMHHVFFVAQGAYEICCPDVPVTRTLTAGNGLRLDAGGHMLRARTVAATEAVMIAVSFRALQGK